MGDMVAERQTFQELLTARLPGISNVIRDWPNFSTRMSLLEQQMTQTGIGQWPLFKGELDQVTDKVKE